jgi:hypothetical protein
LAIFLASFTAIAVLVNLASERAVLAQQRQEAIFKCQSKLAELASGGVPLGSGSGSFDEDPDGGWQWSADATENQVSGLWTVAVTVSRDPARGGPPVSVTLTRMLLDPTVRGNTADSPLSSSTTDSSSGSASGSSGSSGGM